MTAAPFATAASATATAPPSACASAPAAEPRLARVAALVADASRSRMLCLLLDGSLASAGELAAAASITPATASAHLAKLLDAGLLACESRGRHRYYRLADAEVAHALEALAMVTERSSHDRAWAGPARAGLREARCCYGHLAGRLGVALLGGLLARGWLHDHAAGGFVVSAAGAQGFDAMGLDGADWQRRTASGGRRIAYGCLDWSERRDHLAGSLASALLARALEQKWVRRRQGSGRALQCTPAGRLAWRELLPAVGTHESRKPGEDEAEPHAVRGC
ncbi:MAG: helix-turn-helix transcriptional regulator [Rubrivivax sp.]